tara:strand:- start:314 stop:745 length:432 start_codon:yes stop_codon:yes gene_type:complete
MIILSTSEAEQSLSIIPRSYVGIFTMSVRDDSTNVTKTYEITGASTVGNYLTFTNIFSTTLVENHFYDIELISQNYVKRVINDNGIIESAQCTMLFGDTNIIYKDRIFCTDQVINQENNDYYKINKGQFTAYNGYNNDYIVIT